MNILQLYYDVVICVAIFFLSFCYFKIYDIPYVLAIAISRLIICIRTSTRSDLSSKHNLSHECIFQFVNILIVFVVFLTYAIVGWMFVFFNFYFACHHYSISKSIQDCFTVFLTTFFLAICWLFHIMVFYLFLFIFIFLF